MASIEKIIHDEMRFSALEFMVSRIMATLAIATGKTDLDLESWRRDMQDRLRKTAFPGLDPSVSDAASAELEDAVNRLFGILKKEMESLRKASGRS